MKKIKTILNIFVFIAIFAFSLNFDFQKADAQEACIVSAHTRWVFPFGPVTFCDGSGPRYCYIACPPDK